MRPLLPPHISEIRPYTPGRPIEEVERAFGILRTVKLASNENVLGPSPRATAAAAEALADAHRYPDDGGFYLRRVLAARHDVGVEQIVLGAGATSLIELVARTFLGPDDEAVLSEHSFLMYRLAVQGINGNIRYIPMRGYTQDLQATLGELGPESRVLFIANPNNPTGTHVPAEELHSFLEAAPDDLLVVVDNAYCEFACEPDYTCDFHAMVERHERTVALFTFSKSHALAGLRIGYAIGTREVIEGMNRVRTPFGASTVAQMAALAALDDEAHLRRSVEINLEGREQLYAGLDRMGLEYEPTAANFIFLRCDRPGQQVFHELLRRGVIVRPLAGWGIPDAIRVSIGLPQENAVFLDRLGEVLCRTV